MTWCVRGVVLMALSLSIWRVHAIRERLEAEDADPAAVAELRAALDALPRDLAGGQYVGHPEPIADEIVRAAGADSYVSIRYQDAAERSFRVYVGGSIRNRENFHAPNYCMPAQGWETLEQRTVPFTAYPVRQRDPRMRRLLLQRGTQRMLVYYWFQAGDRLADHEWDIRFYRFLDLLAGAPFRPTVITVLYVPVTSSVVEAEEAASAFLHVIGPHLLEAFGPMDKE